MLMADHIFSGNSGPRKAGGQALPGYSAKVPVDVTQAVATQLTKQAKGGRLGAAPIAFAQPNPELAAQAPSAERIAELLAPFKGKSVGQCYRGPGWVDESGLAWVVVLSTADTWARAIRHSQRIGLITWRWNNSPSAPVSLTAMAKGYSKLGNPAPRWFGASHEPVMQAIRRSGRFMVMVARPGGAQSGWLLAEYSHADQDIGFSALERQFTEMPCPGIEGSRRGERFDSMRKPLPNGDRDNEIALWPEPCSDFWSAMGYDGPWGADLQHVDKVQARWGLRLLRVRGYAASAIELLRDRYVLDGETPYFNADGSPTARISGAAFEGLSKAAVVCPGWARLAAAVAGPAPEAQNAFEAAIACISDPRDCAGLVSVGFIELPDIDDEHLLHAFKMFTECALLSPPATQEGLQKPWLANSGDGLILRATPLELSVDIEDVGTYWRQGLELHEVIDVGLWARGSDLPYPLAELGKRMAGTAIEGGIEAAEARTMDLLKEALEARQWSIPWGARIELAVGPFVGLRIYEVHGEFSCLFVDEKGRYYHVAIGLRRGQPQFCSSPFLKRSTLPTAEPGLVDEGDSGAAPRHNWAWDDDSRVTLQLIAAAIVRDFLVVEDREAVFSARAATRRVHGHEVRTVIYLPRVNYHRAAAFDGPPEPEPEVATIRSRHTVAQHLRKAGTASAAQRFLAKRYGVALPEGFTFVRPHERGTAASQERIRVYRSRSASRMLFEVVQTAPVGTRPAWFEFEKDCAALLRRRGLVVHHQAAQRDGDGGIDLYATDKDALGWVAQCKCWGLHRPVGPEVVRELHGAIAKADVGGSVQSRGILITTSRFTSGAVELAETFGYECIDGEAFVRLAAG